MEYFIQGKKGNGKGIQAVALMKEYLEKGKPVATNLNVFLEYLLPPESRVSVFRIPDKPSVRDMELLGSLDTGGDEDKNGLIVLDECLSWLNSREFNDPSRKALFDWFLHSRKHGWDVCYLGQSVDAFDKQFRDSFIEYLGSCWRLDRLPIPFVGWFISLFTGDRTRMPKVFVCNVRYGCAASSPKLFSWWRIGALYYRAYDTLQKFTQFNEHGGVSCTLSAWHIRGRHERFWPMYKNIIIGSSLSGALLAFLLTVSIASMLGYRRPEAVSIAPQADKYSELLMQGSVLTPSGLVFTLSDGRVLTAQKYRSTPGGYEAFVSGVWYRGTSR